MMKKYIFFIAFVVLSFSSLIAQHTISGQVKPQRDVKTLLLYKAEGAFQYYKANTPIIDKGFFGIEIPEKFEKGFYKMVYDAQQDLHVSLIYDKKDISFVFDPEDVINTIYFFESEENTLFYDYIKTVNNLYVELDSIQKLFYENPTKRYSNKYIIKKSEIDAIQDYFEKKSEGKIANKFIVAYKKSLNDLPFSNKDEYFQNLKDNYLSAINFQDSTLRNSSFLIDRINEYVFDLNEAIAKRSNKKIDNDMLDFALNKISDSKFKDEVIYSLTSSAFDPYSSKYDFLLDHLYKNYYSKMPEEAQTKNFTEMVVAKLNAIEGKKATNIYFNETNLYNLKADSTLVIFWSTTCSHCLKEIPKVYEMLANNKNVKVLMVGLEDEYSDWENVSKGFENWHQKRANGKWTNATAIAYNVKGTPSYFILDKNKTIIAKPDKLKNLEAIFKK